MLFSTKTKPGVTLGELLVVVGMVAVVGAVVLPAVVRAADNADLSASMNKAKKLALAMGMYTQDWDGFFPFTSGEYGKCPSPPPDLGSGLLKYVDGDYAAFHVPADTSETVILPDGSRGHGCSFGFPRRAYNPDLIYGVYGWLEKGLLVDSLNVRDIRSPESCVVFNETWYRKSEATEPSHIVECVNYAGAGYFWCLLFEEKGWEHQPCFPHDGVGVFAFADGHVAALSEELAVTAYDTYFPGWFGLELDHRYTFDPYGPKPKE